MAPYHTIQLSSDYDRREGRKTRLAHRRIRSARKRQLRRRMKRRDRARLPVVFHAMDLLPITFTQENVQ